MRRNPCLRKVSTCRITIMMRPIGKREAIRKHSRMSYRAGTIGKRHEFRPEILNVLLVFPFYGSAAHDQHRLQTAFGAEPVQLIGVRPPLAAEKQLCVLSVALMGVGKIG